MQHMQNYTALINPGLAESPYREISIFPDQHGVPDAHKKMYSSPEWTKRSWQNLSSYMSKPDSFQLPVSKTSEIPLTGLEKQIEALDDSSAEEIQASHVVVGLKEHLTGQKSLDICLNSGEGQAGLTAAPQSALLDNLLIKTDDMETKTSPTTSDDLPTELIVSITSAERTVTDACLNSTESKAEHDDNQLSYFPATRFQTTAAKSLNDETGTTKKVLGSPQLTKPRKLNRGQSKDQKHVSKTHNDMITVLDKDHHLRSQKEQQASETGHSQLNNPSNLDSRTVQKCKLRNLSIKSEKLTPATVGLAVSEKSGLGPLNFENKFLMQLQACAQRKKTERWGLKPVISKCGRILVPHGSLNVSDQIKVLQKSRKDKMGQEEMLDISANVQDIVEIDQDSRVAPETMEETKASPSKAEGNYPQKLVSEVSPEHIVLIQSNDENNSSTLNPKRSEHSSQSKGTDPPLVITVQEKPADTPFPSKRATKGELVLNKLKSILLRGKRKEQETTDNTESPEPCLKKGKDDSHVGMLKSMDVISSVQDPDGGIKEVSTLLSVDPQFAFALGLTPKEIPDMTEESEDVGTQERKDSSETHKQTISDHQPQIIQSHLSVFPHGRKIKTLKKDHRMSAEYVKKNCKFNFQKCVCVCLFFCEISSIVNDHSLKYRWTTLLIVQK